MCTKPHTFVCCKGNFKNCHYLHAVPLKRELFLFCTHCTCVISVKVKHILLCTYIPPYLRSKYSKLVLSTFSMHHRCFHRRTWIDEYVRQRMHWKQQWCNTKHVWIFAPPLWMFDPLWICFKNAYCNIFLNVCAQDGSTWHLEKCTRCSCRDGQVQCAVEPCAQQISCPPGHTLKNRPGNCCPSCVEGEKHGHHSQSLF